MIKSIAPNNTRQVILQNISSRLTQVHISKDSFYDIVMRQTRVMFGLNLRSR